MFGGIQQGAFVEFLQTDANRMSNHTIDISLGQGYSIQQANKGRWWFANLGTKQHFGTVEVSESGNWWRDVDPNPGVAGMQKTYWKEVSGGTTNMQFSMKEVQTAPRNAGPGVHIYGANLKKVSDGLFEIYDEEGNQAGQVKIVWETGRVYSQAGGNSATGNANCCSSAINIVSGALLGVLAYAMMGKK